MGLPSELARDVRIDGSVVFVDVDGEPDAAIRSIGASEGWRVVAADDAESACWLASIQKTSLIVITTDRRDAALEVVKAVRRVASAPMVVIGGLTGATLADLLHAGVDLVLPRRLGEHQLRAHLHSVLRRAGETWEPTIRLLSAGEILVDVWTHTCVIGERLVALSPIEFRLLEYLMRYPHQALPANKIVQRVWGTGYAPDLNALRIHVSRLRRKLGDIDQGTPIIRSVRGLGYEFTLNVLEMGDGSSPDVAERPHGGLGERLLAIGRAMPLDSVDAAAAFLAGKLVESGVGDSAAVFQLRGKSLMLVAEHGSSELWRQNVAGGVPLRSNFAQAHAITTRRATQVADIQLQALPYTETARVLAEDGFHSCLFVPVLVGEATWGGLGLTSRSRRPFDPVVTTFCMSAAAMLAIVVGSRRSGG